MPLIKLLKVADVLIALLFDNTIDMHRASSLSVVGTSSQRTACQLDPDYGQRRRQDEHETGLDSSAGLMSPSS